MSIKNVFLKRLRLLRLVRLCVGFVLYRVKRVQLLVKHKVVREGLLDLFLLLSKQILVIATVRRREYASRHTFVLILRALLLVIVLQTQQVRSGRVLLEVLLVAHIRALRPSIGAVLIPVVVVEVGVVVIASIETVLVSWTQHSALSQLLLVPHLARVFSLAPP